MKFYGQFIFKICLYGINNESKEVPAAINRRNTIKFDVKDTYQR